ncbi:hypothetical protein HRbin36_02820 [bacterium HR36]|nr:hypothetical protein HRbin36_02820 [bacterium HR36]
MIGVVAEDCALVAAERFAVIKLGGSLLDMHGLVPKLSAWLDRQMWPGVIVVGGGLAVDWLRRLDKRHDLPVELAHWLAIETMRLNARWLTALLPGAVLVGQFSDCCRLWQEHRLPVLDPLAFCQEDAALPDALPVGWQVTSDSIAAQVAWRWGAAELVLLKSCRQPVEDWPVLAERGLVDAYFPKLAPRVPRIHWVCFRDCTA